MLEPLVKFILQRWKNQLLPRYEVYYEAMSVFSERKCTVGILGLQSVGKTALINTFIGYPVLPSTLTKGTVCPVTVEWGKELSLTAHLEKNSEECRVRIPVHVSAYVFRSLLEYVCLCVNLKIFYPENLSYFLQEEQEPGALRPEDIEMDCKDKRHIMVLMLILLNAHIEISDSQYGGSGIRKAAEKRRELMNIIGLDGGEVVSLHLTWNNDILEKELCILDLPGLGSGKRTREKEQRYSLDNTALRWAKRVDVLLCMTTKEVIGGQMREMVEDINSRKSVDGPPLIVVIVNRADEIKDSQIAINTARQMLWPLKPPCYLISAAAGEYCFLKEGVLVDRTHYWRRKFLPELRCFSPNADITDAVKNMAGERLKENFVQQYDGVEPDGSHLLLSLNEFVKNILSELVRRRTVQMFRSIYGSNTEAAEFLKSNVKNDIIFLDFIRRNPQYLWEELLEKVKTAFAEVYDEYRYAEEKAQHVWEESVRERQSFLDYWQQSINNLNGSFSQKSIDICIGLKHCFGLSICCVEEGNIFHENDRVFTGLFNVPITLDFSMELEPVFHAYEAFFWKTMQNFHQVADIFKKALQQFGESVIRFPMECYEIHRSMGLDEGVFFRYFAEPMYCYVKDINKQCEEVLSAILQPFTARPAAIDFDWNAYTETFLWKCIQEAGSTKYGKKKGRNMLFFSKKKLLKCLEQPIIDSELSVQLLHQLMSFGDKEDIMEFLEESMCIYKKSGEDLKQESDTWWEKAVYLKKQWLEEMEEDLQFLRKIKKLME